MFIRIFLMLLLLAGCKTAEQIKREKMVTNLSMQMVEGQKINANSSARLINLEEKISELKGEVEENSHLTQEKFKTSFKKMTEEIRTLQENQRVLNEFMQKQEKSGLALQAQLKKNKIYLDKLLTSLAKVTAPKKTKAKKRKKRTPYNEAMWNYRHRRYTKAKKQLQNLLASKRIKGNSRARVLHNLGMIQYMAKKYDESKVYFSRLYTEHPKAPYNPNGLLFLGKIFQNTKETEQAKQTFSVLIKSYPKAKQSKEAKKILAQLK